MIHDVSFQVIGWAELDIQGFDYWLYYVYPIGLFLGGVVSVRMNPKYTLLATTLFLSLMNFVYPSVLRSRVIDVSYAAIIIIRVVIGVLEVSPCIH